MSRIIAWLGVSLLLIGCAVPISAQGTQDYIPLWTNSTGTLGNSVVYQSGTGSTAKVGINTTTPIATLTVEGRVQATGLNIQGKDFAYGHYASGNAMLGFAGTTSIACSDNTGVGYLALVDTGLGCNNTAVGAQAMQSNTGGSFSTGIGYAALYSETGTSLTGTLTGSYNTAIGTDALFFVNTGNYDSALGYYAGPLYGNGNVTNSTAIGAWADVTESNTVILGSILNVGECLAEYGCASTSVGIGTTTPDNLLTVNGSADKPGGGSWGTYSDRRLKTLDGSFDSGLSQILKLNPVRYRYTKENALGIRDSEEHVGLVAQDVQEVIPEAVTENSRGYLLLNNDPILWSMLNAIKEQQGLIRQQQEQIRAQQAQIMRLSSQVTAIQTSLDTNGRTDSAVRTVKAQVSTIQQ
jgi:hypothetical protein